MKNKMVIVRQMDYKDCGPCALQSIIRYYGGYVSIEKLREDLYTTSDGTTVYHLVETPKKYGFDCIAKRVIEEELLNIHLPAIIHVKYHNGLLHYMCLYEINNNNKYIIMDPAKGKVVLNNKEFMDIFTGVVIEYSPNNKIVVFDKTNKLSNLFINICKRNYKLCISIIICSICYCIFSIASGTYFKVIYESIISNKGFTLIKIEIYLFLVIYLFKILFEYWTNYYRNHLCKNIDSDVLNTFISHVFKLPLKVITTRSTGEIITRVNDVTQIKDFFSEIIVDGLINILMVIISIIVLFNINAKLSLILSTVMLLYTILSVIINSYYYRRIMNNIDLYTESNSNLVENISMINSIKNLNSTSVALNKIESKTCNYLYDSYDLNCEVNSINFFRNLIYDIGIFIINTYGFYLIINKTLSVADLIVFNNLIGYFSSPIKDIMYLLPKINYLRAIYNKICDFMDIEEEKIGEKDTIVDGNICFNNVSYSYDNYQNTLNNINFTIFKGEKIMLKGKSGSGKSTICNLLEKNIIPNNGEILINGKNIQDYSVNSIRNSITYVSQKENILTDTIKNNILYLNEKEDYDKACNICFIENIVCKRNFRYEFGIDSNLTNISGGEKQRIVLARALCKPSNILILDEALSEVDYKMEENIIKNIIKEYPEKTLIYISHKYQDRLFDKVIKIE